MNRRHFLKGSAAVTSGALGWKSVAFARRGLGLGPAHTERIGDVPPHSPTTSGGIDAVDGQTVSIDIVPRVSREAVRLLVARREYPDGEVLEETLTDPFELRDPGRETTVDVTVPKRARDPDRWFYEVFLAAAGNDDLYTYLCESGPHRWNGGEARPSDRVAEAAESTTIGQFRRDREANTYVLDYDWRDVTGMTWTLRYRLRRSVHEAAVARERGYVRTFEESLSNPIASDFAARLADEATRKRNERSPGVSAPHGAEQSPAVEPTTVSALPEGSRFRILVRFVQGLRYARDFESLDVYEYNRTVEETLVAGVGDCKDKTHLLAGLLSATLSCEVALLFQPAHVLLGVAAGDVPAPFDDRVTVRLDGREYVPVDPSRRFDIGDYPDAPITAAYGANEWLHYDVEAVGQGLDRNVHDWLKNGVFRRG